MTNLIINYLPQTMSQDEIRSLFGSIGEMESCKLIRDKATGQSLGYGFVNYKNPDDARKAVDNLNGLRLQNKTIKVSVARPSCNLIKGANLYVGGLPKCMTVRELENLFAPCGNIITSRILLDQKTETSKGVGFVRYDLRTEAERAIKQLNGVVLPNATEGMTVKFANHPSCLQSLASCTKQFLFNPAAANDKSGCCLFVYNLSPDADDVILWQLFGPFGAVQNVRLARDTGSNMCKGFGFVTMANYEDAVLAIAYLNGSKLGGRVLHVAFKRMKNNGVNFLSRVRE